MAPRIGSLALVDPARIARRGPLYVAEYRLRNMWKWKRAIIAYGLGNPVLYLASVGIGIGALVDARTGGIDGVPYLLFLAPALLASAAIQGAMDEVTMPTLSGFVWQKGFFAMNATALTGPQIALGVLLAAMVRTTFTVTIYWLVLVGFQAVSPATALTLIPAALFAGFAFGAVMLAVTAGVRNDDGFMSLVGRFLITPMFLFSGTFYPLEQLPLGVRWIGWCSPLWHATEVGRSLAYGRVGVLPVWGHLLVLGALAVSGLWIARRRFARRLAA